jgi:hypothetical protein
MIQNTYTMKKYFMPNSIVFISYNTCVYIYIYMIKFKMVLFLKKYKLYSLNLNL